MTTIAAAADKLRELEQETRRAWSEYREKTCVLTGQAYEQAEIDAWTDLQVELRRLERRRRLMTAEGGA